MFFDPCELTRSFNFAAEALAVTLALTAIFSMAAEDGPFVPYRPISADLGFLKRNYPD
jgi:hypothetical protein